MITIVDASLEYELIKCCLLYTSILTPAEPIRTTGETQWDKMMKFMEESERSRKEDRETLNKSMGEQFKQMGERMDNNNETMRQMKEDIE